MRFVIEDDVCLDNFLQVLELAKEIGCQKLLVLLLFQLLLVLELLQCLQTFVCFLGPKLIAMHAMTVRELRGRVL